MKKSKTCYGKISKKPLTEYPTINAAKTAAKHANSQYKQNLIPYKCQKCKKWHLAPKDRQTPSTQCNFCTGADGRPKELYRTKAEATRRADILLEESGKELTVYKCEYNNGWHLTKSSGTNDEGSGMISQILSLFNKK